MRTALLILVLLAGSRLPGTETATASPSPDPAQGQASATLSPSPEPSASETPSPTASPTPNPSPSPATSPRLSAPQTPSAASIHSMSNLLRGLGSSCRIRASAGKGGQARLGIWKDGNLVKVLFEGQVEPGEGLVRSWDGSNRRGGQVGSGVYEALFEDPSGKRLKTKIAVAR